MRDALGGTVNIVIIVVFIVVVAYLAFNVNYTKAFRMKNKIIATYEDYGGNCDSKCRKVIKNYANDVGYNVGGHISCQSDWKPDSTNLFCYREITVNQRTSDTSVDEKDSKHYYKIATRINIEIPIIQNIFSYQLFWVTGDTKSF